MVIWPFATNRRGRRVAARLAALDMNTIDQLIDRVGRVATLDELISELP